MKLKKKTAMLISFTVGTLLLATTALADIASKSGYDQLKDALKVTAEKSSESFDSFTFDFSYVLKDNGKTLTSDNEIKKFDRSMGATESIYVRENLNGEKVTNFNYSDKTSNIRVSESDPTYYVTEYTQERKADTFDNPFKEERAEDIEKIADAIIGSLKDHVVVEQNSDGSKELSGSLTKVQIPTLVNAVASFQLKQEFSVGREGGQMPHLTQDIFVKEVTGTAKINKDGVLENILGSAVLSGKDEQGQAHEIMVEALFKLKDINSTTVTKPDLTGKTVVKNVAKDYSGDEITNPEKFVGKFKNDIVIEKDGKFVKIGERIIDIKHMDNQTVKGRYYDEFKPEFEEYAANKRDFEFNAVFEKDRGLNARFDNTTESGGMLDGSITIDEHGGKLYLNGSQSLRGDMLFDSTFSPDFE